MAKELCPFCDRTLEPEHYSGFCSDCLFDIDGGIDEEQLIAILLADEDLRGSEPEPADFYDYGFRCHVAHGRDLYIVYGTDSEQAIVEEMARLRAREYIDETVSASGLPE